LRSFSSLAFCVSVCCRLGLTLYLYFKPLLLIFCSPALCVSVRCRLCLTLLRSFSSLAFCVSVYCRLGLTLYLYFKPLLLIFCSLQSFFSLGCSLCLALYLLFEPLLLAFSSFQLRLGIGCGLTQLLFPNGRLLSFSLHRRIAYNCRKGLGRWPNELICPNANSGQRSCDHEWRDGSDNFFTFDLAYLAQALFGVRSRSSHLVNRGLKRRDLLKIVGLARLCLGPCPRKLLYRPLKGRDFVQRAVAFPLQS
jgi:hypothetical protein